MRKAGAIAAALLLLAVPSLGTAWAGPAQVRQVKEEALNAVETRARAQKLRDAFVHRQGELLDKIKATGDELDLASKHRRKTQAYLSSQLARLAETRRRIAEAEKIKERLDPLLDQTLAELGRQDQGRAAWDKPTASARLAEVRRVLDDYEAGPAAKVLAVFNELKQRTHEANRVFIVEREIEVAGKIKRVRLMRLGGLAWYALAMDGRQAWIWRAQSGAFQDISSFAGQVDRAMEIAQRHRVAGLVELPLPLADQPKGAESGARHE